MTLSDLGFDSWFAAQAGWLSPQKLKKIRVVHVLDSYERRNEAQGYLW